MSSAQFAFLLIGFAGFGLLAASLAPRGWSPDPPRPRARPTRQPVAPEQHGDPARTETSDENRGKAPGDDPSSSDAAKAADAAARHVAVAARQEVLKAKGAGVATLKPNKGPSAPAGKAASDEPTKPERAETPDVERSRRQ